MIGSGLSAKKVQHFTSSAYYDVKDVKNIGNFVLDKSLSTSEAKVFVNHTKKEVVVSNRGTKGVLDWANNVMYVAGKYDITPRYQSAKSLQQKVLKKYPNYKVINVGHSQSGIITRKLNDSGLTDEVINVNPAALPLERKPKKNETTVKSTADVVSVFHKKGKRDIVLKDKTGNLLTEHKTNIVGRLDPKFVIGLGFTEQYFNFQ